MGKGELGGGAGGSFGGGGGNCCRDARGGGCGFNFGAVVTGRRRGDGQVTKKKKVKRTRG